MKSDMLSYHGYRFPPAIISHAVWLYHRFGVSVREVEDLLAQRGLTMSYEAIRLWCLTFGSAYARRLKRRQGRLGDTWHMGEVFVTIQGQRRHLWRAVDQDGDVIDILVQSRCDCRAATRSFRKLLKGQERQPVRLGHRQAEQPPPAPWRPPSPRSRDMDSVLYLDTAPHSHRRTQDRLRGRCGARRVECQRSSAEFNSARNIPDIGG